MRKILWSNHLKRLCVAGITAFIGYKTLIAAFSSRIPGQPFYAFTARDWFEWMFSYKEFLFIVSVTVLEYAILSIALVKTLKNLIAMAIWGLIFGIYVGVLSYPLDVMSKLEDFFRLNNATGLFAVIAVGAEVVLFVIGLPLGWAAVINLANRRAFSGKPA